MSNIAITPNSSGTGTISITAPNTNTNRTIALPDTAGNVVTTGDSATVTDAMLASGIDASKLGGGGVIQVVHNTGITMTNNTSPTTDTWYDTVVTATITPKVSSSKMFAIITAGVTTSNTNADFGTSLRTKRVISGGATSYPDNLSFHDGSGSLHGMYYGNTMTQTTRHASTTIQGLDGTHSTTSAITYTLVMGSYSANSLSVGGHYNGRWSITIMEIAQ